MSRNLEGNQDSPGDEMGESISVKESSKNRVAGTGPDACGQPRGCGRAVPHGGGGGGGGRWGRFPVSPSVPNRRLVHPPSSPLRSETAVRARFIWEACLQNVRLRPQRFGFVRPKAAPQNVPF